MATKRLGRGINALIRETTDESAQTNPIFHVSLKLVSPNPHQPRQKFDEKSLKELAQSIREKGIIQPITVRTRDKGYELIAGERRLRAAKLAGLTEVPAHVLEIEDDVEIGAHVSVDRPAIGETRIKAGAKVDNLVQIGHGVKVGRNALLAAQVGIAGSTVIEDDVVLAGQVGVNGHVTVGRGTRATGQTGITSSLPAASFVSGLPAMDNRVWRKAATSFALLPALRKKVLALERRFAELEQQGELTQDEGKGEGPKKP